MYENSNIKEDIIQEQILKAAQQLFQQFGLRKVTMDDVAKAIGKRRSSLYYYYKSKEEIFDAVIDLEIKEIIGEITRAIDKAGTAEEKIHVFCTARLSIMFKKRFIYNAWRMDLEADETVDYYKTRDTIRQKFSQQESTLLRKVLDYGINHGEFSPLAKEKLDITIIAIISSLKGLKREMTNENDNNWIESSVNQLCSLLLHGLKN